MRDGYSCNAHAIANQFRDALCIRGRAKAQGAFRGPDAIAIRVPFSTVCRPATAAVTDSASWCALKRSRNSERDNSLDCANTLAAAILFYFCLFSLIFQGWPADRADLDSYSIGSNPASSFYQRPSRKQTWHPLIILARRSCKRLWSCIFSDYRILCADRSTPTRHKCTRD